MFDLEKMQNAALAATQGEWKLAKPQPAAYFDGYINPVSGGELVELQVGINSSYGLLVWKMEDDEVSPKCQANATHIATANPSAILELIERLKAAEASAAQWEDSYHKEQADRLDTVIGLRENLAEYKADAAMKGATE